MKLTGWNGPLSENPKNRSKLVMDRLRNPSNRFGIGLTLGFIIILFITFSQKAPPNLHFERVSGTQKSLKQRLSESEEQHQLGIKKRWDLINRFGPSVQDVIS